MKITSAKVGRSGLFVFVLGIGLAFLGIFGWRALGLDYFQSFVLFYLHMMAVFVVAIFSLIWRLNNQVADKLDRDQQQALGEQKMQDNQG